MILQKMRKIFAVLHKGVQNRHCRTKDRHDIEAQKKLLRNVTWSATILSPAIIAPWN